MTKNLLMACAVAVLTAPLLTACGDDGPFITVYNAQHEELLTEIAPLFEEETGIEVKLRSGDDLELANQLVQEGDASPADVFLTENSPAMSLVDNAGLFTKVDQETLDLIPPDYVPTDQNWIGFMGRSTVAMYNKEALSEEEMPDSILDFADPEWAGRISYSPTGADFQAIVSAVLELKGEQATREWLHGLAENGTEYTGNDVVMESVNSGEVDAGIAYHYYWYRDQKESGDHSDNTELHWFGDQARRVPQQHADARPHEQVPGLGRADAHGVGDDEPERHQREQGHGHPRGHQQGRRPPDRRGGLLRSALRGVQVPLQDRGVGAQSSPSSCISSVTDSLLRLATSMRGGSSSANGLTGGSSETSGLRGYSSA